MTPTIIEACGDYFQVEFLKNPQYNYQWSGKAYGLTHDEPGCYQNDDKPGETTTDIDKARLYFEFNYCWRGVWEGRVYFKQEELWGEDLIVMADLWNKIETIMKERIKKDNPEYKFFDE